MGQEQESTSPKNTVTIEEIGPCKKKVMIEVPADAIKEKTDEQYRDLQKEAVVPGFRKGRAPRRLLEKRFGKETSEQVKLQILAEASDAAIKDEELNVFGEPDVNYEEIELPTEGPLKFEFEVEVWPEFDLPELEGIPVTKPQMEVSDEQIDTELAQLRRLSGVWTPREDGPCAEEDQLLADVVIKAEDVEEAEKLDNTEVYVRKNGFVGSVPVENLDEVLVGAKAGESKQVTVEVAKTYFREEYRGKKVEISLDIKDVKWLKPADLDASFLERFDADSEDDLKEKIRDMLEGRLENQARNEMSEQIYTYLLDNASFDLPLDVVAQQATTVLQRQYVRLLQQGLAKDKIEEQMESLRASSEEQAQEQLKTFFIIDKVCDKLEVEVTDEEVNGHIAQLALQRGQRPEKMKEQMERDGSLSQFRLEIRQNKCISKLLESATITEEKPKKKADKSAKKKKTGAKKTTKKSSKKSDKQND